LLEHVGEISAAAEIEIFDGDVGVGLPGGTAATGSSAAAAWGGAGVDAGVAELVIVLAFLGLGEDVVCFLNLLEFFGGGGIVLVHVRMKFAGELAVGLFDLIGRRGATDAQNFVVISWHKCALILYRRGAKAQVGKRAAA
jgi:hypothetical protein